MKKPAIALSLALIASATGALAQTASNGTRPMPVTPRALSAELARFEHVAAYASIHYSNAMVEGGPTVITIVGTLTASNPCTAPDALVRETRREAGRIMYRVLAASRPGKACREIYQPTKVSYVIDEFFPNSSVVAPIIVNGRVVTVQSADVPAGVRR